MDVLKGVIQSKTGMWVVSEEQRRESRGSAGWRKATPRSPWTCPLLPLSAPAGAGVGWMVDQLLQRPCQGARVNGRERGPEVPLSACGGSLTFGFLPLLLPQQPVSLCITPGLKSKSLCCGKIANENAIGDRLEVPYPRGASGMRAAHLQDPGLAPCFFQLQPINSGTLSATYCSR